MALHVDQLQPATAHVLFDATSYWGPVLTSTTIMMLLPVVLAKDVAPRWVVWLGAVALVEQVVETITIFGHGAFLAPGGYMNTILGAVLVGVWLVCLGVTLGLGRSRSS